LIYDGANSSVVSSGLLVPMVYGPRRRKDTSRAALLPGNSRRDLYLSRAFALPASTRRARGGAYVTTMISLSSLGAMAAV